MRDQPTNAPPPEIEDLARRRSAARHAGDFATADRLRDEITSAGWRVIDQGAGHRLELLHPPDLEIDGVTLYGASATVPPRFAEPDSTSATVVLVAGDDELALERSLAALAEPPSGGRLVVVVADAPAPEVEASLRAAERASGAVAGDVEVLRMATRLGLAAAWNSGVRRAVGSTIVLTGRDVVLDADPLPLAVAALSDPAVAVVGRTGLVSADLRRWQPTDGPAVDAVDSDCLAFRRSDALRRGPLDERFGTDRLLSIWWSLVLRDEGADLPARAALVVDLPVERPGTPPPEADDAGTSPPDRQARRDLYRILDRFGRRYDLLQDPIKPRSDRATGRSR